MPVFLLSESGVEFPDPFLAEPDGLLAVGGSLSVERLVAAYSLGIFPWYNEDSPILWWTPEPRCVLLPELFHIPRSLKRHLAKSPFRLTFDTAFKDVIEGCAKAREDGTWLVPEMVEAYCALHEAGVAHSVEAWSGETLAGGLYGVSLGRVFFGESMFYRVPDASKAALVFLVETLKQHEFQLIDCQQATANLLRFGASAISRQAFMERLAEAFIYRTFKGSWKDGLNEW